MVIAKKTLIYIKKNTIPILLLLSILIMYLITPYIPFLNFYKNRINITLIILTYIIVGWIITRVLNYAFHFTIKKKFKIEHADNLYEREMQTKLKYVNTTIKIVVWLVVIALIFSLFEQLKTIGSSILISAGITSIIIGFAAQKSISNLIAGFQIAFSQPIRIDDVVIVEGEWGKIEEITLTYVVVKIWDNRRLVLPIIYFVDKPFQNWTRTTADILGTVFIYTDYKIPIEKLRKELSRLLKNNKLWNGKVQNIQVTNATEKTIELRILVSSNNSSEAWDLRCFIREKMINFIQKNYPDSLPVTRAELKKKL
jgi:small-conductance mechanosensitive channel